jgi:hypothetical protein
VLRTRWGALCSACPKAGGALALPKPEGTCGVAVCRVRSHSQALWLCFFRSGIDQSDSLAMPHQCIAKIMPMP